jgi:hypothetical protein
MWVLDSTGDFLQGEINQSGDIQSFANIFKGSAYGCGPGRSISSVDSSEKKV